MTEYVVNTSRLRNYLYSLGFNYRQVIDQKHNQEFIWLFQKNDLLMESITYYTKVKNIMISKKI
ncbi:hypothetical protein [Clostridium estertheticum]|uniref:hypothetical protein n=1 Tax=Clostridium estertheticum TaxID=238834 RepID=UPI001CF4AE52|nr:hypothetical protein [Clostridium estertheticum]MCB2354360.1 hypothetical protein [Clostridium estertheticum]WAG42521.1 hypothetical protein LL065_07565 [Clostridium estertheticum]